MSGASIEETLELWAASLREVKARMRPLFRQERVAASAGLFLDGLLGEERRKTGWMRAEAAGDPGPWQQQAILGRGRWEADALRDTLITVCCLPASTRRNVSDIASGPRRMIDANVVVGVACILLAGIGLTASHNTDFLACRTTPAAPCARWCRSDLPTRVIMPLRAAVFPVSCPRSTIMRSAISTVASGLPEHPQHRPAQGHELVARRVAALPRLDRLHGVGGIELSDHRIQTGEVCV